MHNYIFLESKTNGPHPYHFSVAIAPALTRQSLAFLWLACVNWRSGLLRSFAIVNRRFGLVCKHGISLICSLYQTLCISMNSQTVVPTTIQRLQRVQMEQIVFMDELRKYEM